MQKLPNVISYLHLLNIADLNQILTYLDSIEGGTLTDLVARKPEGETILVAEVLAHTTDEDIVLAGSLQRHRIDEVRRVVNQRTARSSGNGLLSLLDTDGTLGLNSDTLRVRT